MIKICIVSDTYDDVNGVCTTLKNTVRELKSMHYDVMVIEPSQFKTFKFPKYPEIKISIDIWKVGQKIKAFNPDHIHVATEGPLGFAARWYCKVEKRSIPHNTSYHTRWPEYLNTLYNVPIEWGYFAMRLFHKFSTKVLVTTETMKKELTDHGFENLEIWNRGVDTHIFNPDAGIGHMTAHRPILLCVSRASMEKGLDDFCQLQTAGTKILVGDGPYLEALKSKYSDVKFIGYKHGAILAHFYAQADVFVFPSKTDTFGVVMLEANACGTPVAAYPVNGPLDVVIEGINGSMNVDLDKAVNTAMLCDRQTVAQHALKYSWKECTLTFLNNLPVINHQ
jgi:glycosyltransferase involved in cell wall biosynthesis